MSGFQQFLEVVEGTVLRVDTRVSSNVVAVVPQRRRIERQEPERCDTQILEVIQLRCQAAKGAVSIANTVEEGSDVDLINDCVFIPEQVVVRHERRPKIKLDSQGAS